MPVVEKVFPRCCGRAKLSKPRECSSASLYDPKICCCLMPLLFHGGGRAPKDHVDVRILHSGGLLRPSATPKASFKLGSPTLQLQASTPKAQRAPGPQIRARTAVFESVAGKEPQQLPMLRSRIPNNPCSIIYFKCTPNSLGRHLGLHVPFV